MKVLHVSMECYPAAKSGGLGDVAGSLPIYLNRAGTDTAVVMPKFGTKWLNKQSYKEVFAQHIKLGEEFIWFAIEEVTSADLGFPLYVANIPSKFDRPGVYSDPGGDWYRDEVERSICFQQAVLKWVVGMQWKPKILHCHDHHTGLIPFMVRHCIAFQSLRNMPTVFTIHNGAYSGAFSWDKYHLLPYFDAAARGLLDWGNAICPLAAGIKCCWRLTTVSPGYMDELQYDSNGMESLIRSEMGKASGIINGIDTDIWDPAKDPMITHRFDGKDVKAYKASNKEQLLNKFRIIPDLPIITFIGRLVREKGADLLPETIRRTLGSGIRAGFIILGTGDKALMDTFASMQHQLSGYFDVALEYNETLAHQLYAGSDFLIMPSRVEPCGLNQMFACRYGTVPVVRSVGGLRDTIPDIGEQAGRGIRFDHFNADDASMAIYRATRVYASEEAMDGLRERIMQADFSWERSANAYAALYESIS